MAGNYFRFSLRTTFITITALCLLFGYVGYEYSWIRERRAFISNKDLCASDTYIDMYSPDKYKRVSYKVLLSPSTNSPPLLLWLFGERKVYTLMICIEPNEVIWTNEGGMVAKENDSIAYATKLFPESGIVAISNRHGISQVLGIE
jgi:hypothetical protein